MSFDQISVQGTELLPERIANALRKAIVEGVLAPGTRLTEQDLSGRLGVSRVPLREAFRLLEGEGFVAIQPNRGAVVSERSDTELKELFAVRTMFEAYAVRVLTRERPTDKLAALDAMVADMKVAVRGKDVGRYARLAASFHETLIACSGNTLLAKLYGQIRLNLRRYQAVMSELPESPAKSIREHARILAAIRASDPDAAALEAESHLGALVRRFEAGRRSPPATRAPSRAATTRAIARASTRHAPSRITTTKA